MKKNFLLLIIAIAILVLPDSLFAQAPVLGTAGDYVLFTTTGAVTNTGSSQITGNVGTNSGAITGFGNVNGVLHTADAATLAASGSLSTAYTQLNTATQTGTHAPAYSNETVTPGVYRVTGNSTISNTVTLDGQNNAASVFIFKMSGKLATASNTKIVLINGALACNVFWKTEGAVSLGSLTEMKGTIVANNAAIDIASGVTIEGRALSTTGAITLNSTLAYIPTGCGSIILTGPAAPLLGSVGCYALFSGNGSVTNAGLTYVTGDIGTNVGLTTGYDPLLVNGMIHPIPDVSTVLAAADLLVVRNYLNLLPKDIDLLYPAQFGNDLVLTPHTYLMTGAAALTGNVTLNAMNNANAVFVIRILGAFSTATFSKVILSNGAQAKNVFWQIEGAVTINDYSTFKGTIVTNNAAINLNTGVNIDGRALTTNGAFSTAADTVLIPAGTCSAPLPVSWLYFKGKAADRNVVLEWSTTKETDNGFFTLEKSNNGINFSVLTTMRSANGGVYVYTDHQPYANNYYRISQTDIAGRKNVYRTIQVNINEAAKSFSYVSGNFIFIETANISTGAGAITLYGSGGSKISSKNITLTQGVTTYQIEKPSHKGIYFIVMSSNNGIIYKGKILVN